MTPALAALVSRTLRSGALPVEVATELLELLVEASPPVDTDDLARTIAAAAVSFHVADARLRAVAAVASDRTSAIEPGAIRRLRAAVVAMGPPAGDAAPLRDELAGLRARREELAAAIAEYSEEDHP